jgi:hypothetical protein
VTVGKGNGFVKDLAETLGHGFAHRTAPGDPEERWGLVTGEASDFGDSDASSFGGGEANAS